MCCGGKIRLRNNLGGLENQCTAVPRGGVRRAACVVVWGTVSSKRWTFGRGGGKIRYF